MLSHRYSEDTQLFTHTRWQPHSTYSAFHVNMFKDSKIETKLMTAVLNKLRKCYAAFGDDFFFDKK